MMTPKNIGSVEGDNVTSFNKISDSKLRLYDRQVLRTTILPVFKIIEFCDDHAAVLIMAGLTMS